MIRVTIELLSANREEPKKLATLDICNQNPLSDFADYTVSYSPVNARPIHGVVHRHNRTTGFLPLVAAAFKALYGPYETFKEARSRLLKELAMRGWAIKPELKVPTAISMTLGPDLGYPDCKVKLYFHPQSVYLHDHSMHIDDIRGMSVESFLTSVMWWVQTQENNPETYHRG